MDNLKINEIEDQDLTILNSTEAISYMTGFQDGVNAILMEIGSTEWLKDFDSISAVKNYVKAFNEYKLMQDAGALIGEPSNGEQN